MLTHVFSHVVCRRCFRKSVNWWLHLCTQMYSIEILGLWKLDVSKSGWIGEWDPRFRLLFCIYCFSAQASYRSQSLPSICKGVRAGQVEQAKQHCISRVPHLLFGLQSRRAALHLLKLHSNLIPSKSQEWAGDQWLFWRFGCIYRLP